MWSCSTHGRDENSYKILVSKPERMRPLGRTKRRSENNIKMNLQKIRREVWTGFIGE
jgi:hypothetical protein